MLGNGAPTKLPSTKEYIYMRNEKFEDIVKRIPLDEVKKYYIDEGLSVEKCAKALGVCYSTASKLIKYYNIVKPESQRTEEKAKNLSQNRGYLFNSVIERISCDEIYQLYIIDNKSYDFLLEHYNITPSMLDKVLRYYNIHKSRKQSSSLVLDTKYSKYGGKEAYDAVVAEKTRKTIIDKDGSLESHYQKVQEKVAKTYEERYGSRNFYNKDAMRATCLERYGVEAPCMLPQARMRGNNSKPNLAFAQLLEDNHIVYEREFNLDKYSYDFKVGNILIEIDPSITHNITFNPFGRDTISPSYHKDKSDCAKENGFRCIHIFDWDDANKIVNLLTKRNTVYARECKVMEVGKDIARDYLETFHLQGYAKDEIRLALVYGDMMIVSMMTFGKPRYNKKFDYEIIRYCSNYNVIGGAEKLFKYFVDKYSPTSIISYCDDSKFNGDIYGKLNFRKTSCKLSKHWFNLLSGEHITDNLLRQRGFDQLFNEQFGKGTSNEELMREYGFVEVYDCGQSRYEWYNLKNV